MRISIRWLSKCVLTTSEHCRYNAISAATQGYPMINRRYQEARGLDEDRPFYGFYTRLSGQDRELLKEARRVAMVRLGATPSNPVLLAEMMKTYVNTTP